MPVFELGELRAVERVRPSTAHIIYYHHPLPLNNPRLGIGALFLRALKFDDETGAFSVSVASIEIGIAILETIYSNHVPD
mmetsp:Transcript_14277/g.10326  ORF Transcript_14277/g.10326 Transcript_14277/m.10326 type:complete len:80 (-) Transcript_14277:649-888(-)